MGGRMVLPLPSRDYELKILLIGIGNEGNLGAIARTMLNFGFNKLELLNPEIEISEESRKRAKHAGTILDEVVIHKTWEDAVDGSSLVVGTSGKRELGEKTLRRHFIMPWEFSEKINEKKGSVLLVFGPEGTGLNQKQLHDCDLLITIPTWEGYPILNISHSVSNILYELYKTDILSASTDPAFPKNSVELERRLDPKLRQLLRHQIEELENALPRPEERKSNVARTLTRCILRGQPTDEDAQNMLGVLLDSTNALKHAAGDDDWKKNRKRRVEFDN